jgi:hypothetical protein
MLYFVGETVTSRTLPIETSVVQPLGSDYFPIPTLLRLPACIVSCLVNGHLWGILGLESDMFAY